METRNIEELVLVALVEARDLNERQGTERPLRDTEEHLPAQRLEALGTLVGKIAHDFNNVLTAIVALTELIDIEAESPSAVRENLAEVRQATARAAELVGQIAQARVLAVRALGAVGKTQK